MLASSGDWAGALKGTVAERLKELGVRGVLVQMAENGQLLELECEMPTCYCPKGSRRFQYRPEKTTPSPPLPDWAPNPDHYPRLKMDGGHLDPWNVRLAHVHCNQVDFASRGRIRRMLEKDKKISFERIAKELNDKSIQPPRGTNTWSAATARKAYVS